VKERQVGRPPAIYRVSDAADEIDVIVLGIDTAGPAGSVALVGGGEVLGSLYIRRSSAFSRPLLRSIDQLFDWTGYTLADLQGLAVNVGPGAFTGIRIGLAMAQGLAMASGKPLVGCSAFEALVALAAGWEGAICPVLNAYKGEVYAALYHRVGRQVQQVMPGMVVTPEVLCTLVRERTLFLGSGVKTYGAVLTATLGESAVCVDTGLEEVGLAVSIARVGQTRLQEAETALLPMPRPLYIRSADARLPRRAVQTRSATQEVPPGV
jgi:tRNA threonylcarbamoyladenosine biosynthesis protein TsaB